MRADGVPRSTIDDRRRRGDIVEVRPRVYAYPGVVMDHETRALAAVLWAGDDALACCGTAAALHDLAGWRFPANVHVLVPPGRGRTLRALTIHRSSVIRDEDRAIVSQVPCTSPTRTVFDLSATATEAQRELLMLELVRRRLGTFAGLREAAALIPNARGVGELRRALDVYDPTDIEQLASILESLGLRVVARAGLPRPQVNRDVREVAGQWLARVDFRWELQKVTMELDGLRFHSTRGHKRYDDRRQNRLVIAGERVVRYDLYALRHESARVVDELRSLLLPRLAV